MSWSVNLIGHPNNIIAALDAESKRLKDQSKVEFDAVREHLAALVKENFNTQDTAPPIIRLEANGHGMSQDGEQKYRNVAVTLQPIYGQLV